MVDTTSSKGRDADLQSFKIVMLGDAGVGKTCIVNRLMKNAFTQTESTLGSNFSSKVLTV